MNSTVKPIFNEKSCWKVRFVSPVIEKLLKKLLCVHCSHPKVNNYGLKKKKKRKKNAKCGRGKCVLRFPNAHLIFIFYLVSKLLKKLLCVHCSHSKVNNYDLEKKKRKKQRKRIMWTWEARFALSKCTLNIYLLFS